MTTDQIITIATGIIQGGGVIVFIYYYIGGLRQKIMALNDTIGTQSKTLEVMEERIEQTKGIGEIYKELINEMPEDLRKYKEFIRESKDAMIEELHKRISETDQVHKTALENSLNRIHEQEKSIVKLSKAREKLIAANNAIQKEMESISQYYQSQGVRDRHPELRSIEIYIQHKGNLNIEANNVTAMHLISAEPRSTDQNSGLMCVDELKAAN